LISLGILICFSNPSTRWEPEMSDNDDYMAGKNGHVGDVGNPHYSLGMWARGQEQQQNQLAEAMARSDSTGGPDGSWQQFSKFRRAVVWTFSALFGAVAGLHAYQQNPSDLWTIVWHTALASFVGAIAGGMLTSVVFWGMAISFGALIGGLYWWVHS
jgi:hypothetical protein